MQSHSVAVPADLAAKNAHATASWPWWSTCLRVARPVGGRGGGGGGGAEAHALSSRPVFVRGRTVVALLVGLLWQRKRNNQENKQTNTRLH